LDGGARRRDRSRDGGRRRAGLGGRGDVYLQRALGHVCQFQINTGAGPIAFALPAHEKKRVAGVTPGADSYCVCDPGPVTPDCKAPQLDHWCMGQWMAVDPGLNSENDAGRNAFAAARPLRH